MSKLFLVRHGESWGNVDKSEYFRTLDCDIELTDKGAEQAIEAGHTIWDLNGGRTYVGNIFYSPYVRAQQTAKEIYEVLSESGVTNYVENVLLHEREWGGLRDIVNSGQKNEGHFNFFYRPLNGESFSDCYQRVVLFDNWMKQSYNSDAIVVAHGEFIKLYCMHLMRWTVGEFEQWKTPRNGEVLMFDNGVLSSSTPLTPKVITH